MAELLAKGLDKQEPRRRDLSARLSFHGKFSAKLGEEYWQARDYDLSVDDLEEFQGYQ